MFTCHISWTTSFSLDHWSLPFVRGLQAFLLLTESLGLPVKASKTIELSSCVILHGIEVYAIAQQLRLPSDKLSDAQSKVAALCKRKKASLRELQSLLGILILHAEQWSLDALF